MVNQVYFVNLPLPIHRNFIAVLVENFFERPEVLMKSNNELYVLATKILRQDPLKMGTGSEGDT